MTRCEGLFSSTKIFHKLYFCNIYPAFTTRTKDFYHNSIQTNSFIWTDLIFPWIKQSLFNVLLYMGFLWNAVRILAKLSSCRIVTVRSVWVLSNIVVFSSSCLIQLMNFILTNPKLKQTIHLHLKWVVLVCS